VSRPKTGQVSIRSYKVGDEEGILDLYEEVFPHAKVDPALWRWTYRDTPGGPSIIVVGEDEGRLIAHYAVQPRPFCAFGKSLTFGFVLGTMIHPRYRNVTTFINIAKAAYREARARGIPILYAFPNDAVWPVRQKMLGWKPLKPMVELAASLEKIAHLAHAHEAVRPTLEEELATSFLRADGPVVPLRDGAWLKWRYFEHPRNDYEVLGFWDGDELAGYLVLKRYRPPAGQGVGHIIDWRTGAPREDVDRALFEGAIACFTAWEVGAVSLWLGPASSKRKLVARAGFEPGRETNFGFLALDPNFEELVGRSDAWDVMMADSDVY
jgi:hypothetical protein